jgi:large subunit ribosomal protein L7/L12
LQTRLNIQDIAMPVAMPSAPAGGAAAPVEEEKPVEKTEFKVKLEKIDPAAKAKVIREVKNLTGMNLVEVLLQHLVVFYVSRLGMYLTFS